MDWFGYELSGVAWVGPVLGTFVFVWGGWPFLKGAVDEVRDRAPGMMLLIAMAITVAWASSMASSLGWFDLEFWWELAALVTIMLLGHWQEMKAIGQAQGALAALAALLPDEAEVIDGDRTRTVAIGDLHDGQLVLVRAGGRVPADGIDRRGRGRARRVDDHRRVQAGRQGCRRPGGRRHRLDRLVDPGPGHGRRRRHRARRHPTARRRSASVEQPRPGARRPVRQDGCSTSPPRAAVITFVAWSVAGDPDQAVTSTVTVLVIACPHALGLAIPLVIALSTAVVGPQRDPRQGPPRAGTDADHHRRAVRQDRHPHRRPPRRHRRRRRRDRRPTRCCGWPAASKLDSEHPLARAIVDRRPRARRRRASASEFRAITGRGVEAVIDGHRYAVGGPVLLRERSLTIPDSIRADVDAWTARGAAVLYLVRDDEIIGAFALEDKIRPEARQAVIDLHDDRHRASRDDHRRRPPGRRRRRGRTRHRRSVRRGAARGQAGQGRRAASPRRTRSRWSATASTTHPRSPAPTSVSRSAPAPTSRSNPPASSSPATTHARSSV